MGRSTRKRKPTQEKFEPLVTAPMVSVTSRVVYILRHLIAGTAAKMSQLFSRQQTRSTMNTKKNLALRHLNPPILAFCFIFYILCQTANSILFLIFA
jgi:segregation and condensation protein A